MKRSINELWNSTDTRIWEDALSRYWDFVKNENMELERELDNLNLQTIENLDSDGWYEFLLNKYFRWKYTAPNRYSTTTRSLRRYVDEDSLDELYQTKLDILLTGMNGNIRDSLTVACKIHGLGTAGASGLLSLIFPNIFGTVDQFAVKALREINGLDEHLKLIKMKEESLTISNGVHLIDIMQRKAADNNLLFGTKFWTPRKIDMILWTFR